MNRSWMLVIIGAFFEVGWVVGLKHADSFLTWSLTIIAIVLSFALLLKAVSTIPVGTAYAVFVGLGTTGTVIIDMVVFDEPFQLVKIALIAMLLIGVIGLKMVTGNTKTEGGDA